MTSRLLLSLVASFANGLPFVTFLPMLEALTTRLISVASIDTYREGALWVKEVCEWGDCPGSRGMLLLVGEWELAFRPGIRSGGELDSPDRRDRPRRGSIAAGVAGSASRSSGVLGPVTAFKGELTLTVPAPKELANTAEMGPTPPPALRVRFIPLGSAKVTVGVTMLMGVAISGTGDALREAEAVTLLLARRFGPGFLFFFAAAASARSLARSFSLLASRAIS